MAKLAVDMRSNLSIKFRLLTRAQGLGPTLWDRMHEASKKSVTPHSAAETASKAAKALEPYLAELMMKVEEGLASGTTTNLLWVLDNDIYDAITEGLRVLAAVDMLQSALSGSPGNVADCINTLKKVKQYVESCGVTACATALIMPSRMAVSC